MSDAAALARWLLLLEVAAWGLYPLLYLATPGLPDRGLTVAKPFALLVLAYPAWLLASVTGLPVFATPALLITLVALSSVGWAFALWSSRALERPALSRPASGNQVPTPSTGARPRGEARVGIAWFLHGAWRYALATELLFIAAFLGYAWLRGYNPEILGTEKPMDMGFLTSALRGATMPPADPWLSGNGINYYYFGFVIVAAIGKLTVVPPGVAFNLALGTVVAMTFVAATGVTANLFAAQARRLRTRHLAVGYLGGYFVAIAGNMYAARDILVRGQSAIDAWWWGGLGWKSSRVVIDSGFPASIFGPNAPPSETINEFPFFSFILGDLHAHVLALPFTLLALALVLDVWLDSPLRPRHAEDRSVDSNGPSFQRWISLLPAPPALARLALGALAIGSLYALNSWDLPTYGALYLAALLVRRLLRDWPDPADWVAAGLVTAVAFALFLPYYLQFTSLVGGEAFNLPQPWASLPLVSRVSRTLGLVIWSKTPADQFLTVFLLPVVSGVAFLAWRWWRGARGSQQASLRPVLALLGLALAATLLQMPVLLLAGGLVLLATAVLRYGQQSKSDDFATLLFGAAMALLIVTEVFFIHDVFGNRMNTVFKVYYQAWTLLGIASAYAVVRLLKRPMRGARDLLVRTPVALIALVLMLASAAYPLAGSWARTEHFARRTGLDGMAFVARVAPDEYAGIEFVRRQLPPGAVVAEAPGCSYGEWLGVPHDRVAAFAGSVTPLGWIGHERQWRGGDPALLRDLTVRQDEINTLFNTTDLNEASRLLDKYRIQYIYVGQFERLGYRQGGIGAGCAAGPPYAPAGLAKFDTLMVPIFQQGIVTIYEWR